jgi:transposase
MFTCGGQTRIWLATGVTDLRRGFNGLHALIAHEFGQPPLNGDLYVFANRRRDLLKIFFFDAGGIWVCGKRLEAGSYRWPRPGERLVTLRPAELQLLLSGIDLQQTQPRRWWQPPALAPTPAGAAPPPSRPGGPVTARSDQSGTLPDRVRAAGSFPPP